MVLHPKWSRNKWIWYLILAAFVGLLLLLRSDVTIPDDKQAPDFNRQADVVPLRTMTGNNDDGYDKYFSRLLRNELGPVVSRALYHPSILPAAALSFDDSTSESLFGELVENWTDHLSGSRPVLPMNQRTTAGRLRLLKLTTSIGVGRVHRDTALRAMYNVPKMRNLVRSELRKLICAFTAHLFIGLQMIVDVVQEEDPFHRILYEKGNAWEKFDVDTDPLLLLLSQLDHNAREADAALLYERILSGDFLQNVVPKRERTSPTAYVRLHSIEYHRTHIIRSFPGVGKFWNYFRPITSCFSTVRSCEEPEGCRNICNPHYLRSAGASRHGAYYHRLVGFGSNNHFGWEESVVRMILPAANVTSSSITRKGKKGYSNGLRLLLTLDCTVGEWNIPEPLKLAPNFMTSRLCVDRTSSNTTSISIDKLKEFVLYHAESSLRRKQGDERSELQGLDRKDLLQGPTVSKNSFFDGLSLLKLDVEGHEHTVFPMWAKLELRDLKHSKGKLFEKEVNSRAREKREEGDKGERASSVTVTAIDFERDAPSFFTTSMVQLELHEYVGGKPPTYEQSVLQGFRMQQYLASLGFLQVAQERNAMSDCCFELVYVHYRYLIRSEVWTRSED